MAGTGHPSNPPGRSGHVLAGGAPSGSLHGGGRSGRRQTPSMGKITWSRTSPITSPLRRGGRISSIPLERKAAKAAASPFTES